MNRLGRSEGKEVCRTYGACRFFAPTTQHLRAGLKSSLSLRDSGISAPLDRKVAKAFLVPLGLLSLRAGLKSSLSLRDSGAKKREAVNRDRFGRRLTASRGGSWAHPEQ